MQKLVLLLGLVFFLFFIDPAILKAHNNPRIPVFKRPIEVLNAVLYKDGGTLVIQIKDKDGRKMIFCKDNRMFSGDGSIYYGSWYPSNKNAIKINPRDKTIEVLLCALKEWLKDYKPKNEKDKFKAKYVAMFIMELERYLDKIKTRTNPITSKDAIRIAKKAAGFLVKNYREVKVRDDGSNYQVIFIGVPFEDNGKKYECDFEVVVHKNTGDVGLMASLRYYKVN